MVYDALTDVSAIGKTVNFLKTAAFTPLTSGSQFSTLFGALAKWYDEIALKVYDDAVVRNDCNIDILDCNDTLYEYEPEIST